MSYAVSAPLQAAIYRLLLENEAVTQLVGRDVYDSVPAGAVPDLYVSLGPEVAVARSDATGGVARHQFTISVVAQGAGFHTAKTVAGAVSDVIDGARPGLDRGRVVQSRFMKAVARRDGAENRRRIDLRFEAVVEDD